MQLGCEDELQPVERRAERAHVTFELLERRGRISGNARRLQCRDEE